MTTKNYYYSCKGEAGKVRATVREKSVTLAFDGPKPYWKDKLQNAISVALNKCVKSMPEVR